MQSPYAPENEPKVQSATDLFGNYRLADKFKPSGKRAASERAMIIGMFLERLNPARKASGYRELTPTRLGKIFEGMSEQDLYYLDSICKQAKSYSRLFWYKMRERTRDVKSSD